MNHVKITNEIVDVSPNPFSSYTIITIPEEASKPYSLVVFDNEGDKVLSHTNIISNKFILSGSILQKGTYFYKIFNPDFSFLFTGKITVN